MGYSYYGVLYSNNKESTTDVHITTWMNLKIILIGRSQKNEYILYDSILLQIQKQAKLNYNKSQSNDCSQGAGIDNQKTGQFSQVLEVFHALMKMGQVCVDLLKHQILRLVHFIYIKLTSKNIFVGKLKCVCVRACMCVFLYMHTHTHTYVCIHTMKKKSRQREELEEKKTMIRKERRGWGGDPERDQ